MRLSCANGMQLMVKSNDRNTINNSLAVYDSLYVSSRVVYTGYNRQP